MEFCKLQRMFVHPQIDIISRFEQYIRFHNITLATHPLEWFASMTELLQSALNWPCYKIWPEYVRVFSKTKLTGVPLSELRSPFPAWTLYLPTTDCDIKYGSQSVHAITMFDYGNSDVEKALEKLNGTRLTSYSTKVNRTTGLIIRITDPAGTKDLMSAIDRCDPATLLAAKPNVTVEELLDAWSQQDHTRIANPLIGDIDPVVYETCWRLAISVAFLAIGQDRIISPDILNKDMAAYLAAVKTEDNEAVAKMALRAERRRHERGWTIGKFHEIVVGKHISTEDSDCTARELQHQHMRSAHFHAYWVGPGRTEKKVRFVLPVTVRADLPLPPQSPDRVIRS